MLIRQRIERKLTEGLAPQSLRIIDESAHHAGHAGQRSGSGHSPLTGETHFRVEIVAAAFAGQSKVARQRTVYALLAEELNESVHALSLSTQTPEEAARAAAS